MKLEIITHCWRYSRLLAYQLSSLVNHLPVDVKTKITVCCCRHDAQTLDMISHFASAHIGRIDFNGVLLSKSDLLQRSIGRNFAAKQSAADMVWFTDCDYYFGPGCLDFLPKLMELPENCFFPRTTNIHKTHEIGDEYIKRVLGPSLQKIDYDDFTPMKNHRAIGGIQIVKGDVARRGYLKDIERWQTPVEGDQWLQSRSDKHYRGWTGEKWRRIDIPGLYRLRHSRAGYREMCDN